MDRSRFGQGGLFAAGAAVAVAAVMAVSGADGARAAADHGLYARDAGGPCYSTSARRDDVRDGERRPRDRDRRLRDLAHRRRTPRRAQRGGGNDVPADPDWTTFASHVHEHRLVRADTFTQPGAYRYVCQAHAEMEGTITVTGDPIGTPTPATHADGDAHRDGHGHGDHAAERRRARRRRRPAAPTVKTRPTVRLAQLKALRAPRRLASGCRRTRR